MGLNTKILEAKIRRHDENAKTKSINLELEAILAYILQTAIRTHS